jgi:23S rRNA pseudouridine2605 synthase
MNNKNSNEKLQKILARAGLGSRRQMEEWIQNGRVKVNGHPAHLGLRVSETDRVSVDGKRISWKPQDAFKTRILAYYKPEGIICTRSDPEGRPTVFDQLPKIAKGRWISIGRLDINTMGLLLLTNNGELTHRLMHPSFQIEREYAVRVFGEIQPDIISRLKTGVELEDGKARFESIQDAGGAGINHWYHVMLKKGRCRLVRRLWESQGIRVSRLLRIRYGNINLPRSLRAGRWVELEGCEVEKLLTLVFPEHTYRFLKKDTHTQKCNLKPFEKSRRSKFGNYRKSVKNLSSR